MHMKQQMPTTLAEFDCFYSKKYEAFKQEYKIDLYKLPESMVLGLIFEFMDENAVDFSTNDISKGNLVVEILDALKLFDDTITHYS